MKKIVFYLLILTISGCIETFEPTIDLDTTAIVITGIITDLNPAQVEIARPVMGHIKEGNMKRVSGATVLLFDDQGNQEQLTEIKNGYYQGILKGVVGREYHINVHLPNNDIINSSPQLLKPCPSIDSLFLEQISYLKADGAITQLHINGLSLNLYMNRDDALSRYFKWKVGGTYSRYTAFDINRQEPPCYITLPADFNFTVGESMSSNADLLWKKLKLIKPDGTYAFGHSVEVEQYSLTKEAYNYWKKIEDQQSNVGSVFDPPPAQITGNLSYVDDQNIPAIGFFEVSGVKKKRIFINSTFFLVFPEKPNQFSTRDLDARCFPPFGWAGPFISPHWCDDCLLIENSTKIKPSYWPE
ncbi:MAG: DUF4249 domain-containing protein [Cyclobacteriaceae bacterium]|nr:DUF4249 domain-containing protein [Cyclobacteriaceae bacterium]